MCRRDIAMLRMGILGLAAIGLSGCGISMPSLSASMGGQDTPAPRARGIDQDNRRTASVGGGLWQNIQSPFGKKSGKTADNAALMVSKFNPEEAQAAINAYRAQKGLSALKLNAKLTQAAKAHSTDLARNDRISHFGSDGSDIEERARRVGYVFNLIAENVGTGQRTSAEVIEGWRQSPSHNENLLLSDASEMGIAVVYRPETEFQTFWTLVLGTGQ